MKVIKHLVLPGGAIYGFSFYGALKYLQMCNVWNINNIQTIHCTSVGGIVGVIIALKYDWKRLDKYLLEQPWNELFHLNVYNVYNCFRTNGMFSENVIKTILQPLFREKQLSIDITLQEFFEKTNIAIHFYTVQVEKFELQDVSHVTHPNWKLMDAIYCSACAPILFKPFEYNGELYTDGCLIANYPIKQILDHSDIKSEEILGIKLAPNPTTTKSTLEKVKVSMLDYIGVLLRKGIEKITGDFDYKIGVEVNIDANFVNSFYIFSIMNSPEKISEMIEYGSKCAKDSLPYL